MEVMNASCPPAWARRDATGSEQGDGWEGAEYWDSLVYADVPHPLPCAQVPTSLILQAP